ncbi:energy-coupling factor transport system substrate-specific component [Thermosyntropha lipolytica DSM 11003]|uniref:Energy-coupling factor transport system substrate-specific component n=1 Tax=Thermosyntropha lipolytica DSM 11003 TaxID=1123382 RepID=A0A1M5QDD9_9FIRM|nr:ECF transporter S component [Thermosyntropha lipolytica]SHH11749.1 energy-coupling factor transport system substrate-specific component [Thermosyntropha lipolytica DSM 11003]
MHAGLIAGIIGLVLLGIFFWRLEKKTFSSYQLALTAAIAALAATSRVAFAPFPNITPSTFITMITGYTWGIQAGFVVGALSGLISNFFLGQGPWTLWQMVAWGLCGALAGMAGKMSSGFNRPVFTLLCFAGGYLFGLLMNLWHWLAFVYPLNIKTFLSIYAAGFPFDTMHAAGNAVFAFLLGPPFYKILLRYK